MTAPTFEQALPFGLDAFQRQALEAVEAGDSVLVSAPTGSGKTVVAEFACWLALQRGAKCFYTTPIKALSNQKFGDLIAEHGARNVGLLTGDNSINGEAPLVVMTTEVLRNMLYERSSTLDGLRWVVLDEVHYLQDPYRGAVWEEVLIHLPPGVRVVCLSATVSNVAQFGEWISELRGPTRVIEESERPVELRSLVMVADRLYPLLAEGGGPNPELARLWTRGVRAHAARRGHRKGPREDVYTPTRVEVLEVLERERMLPAIVFIFSRAGCDEAVEACIRADVRLTNTTERRRISEYVQMRTSDLDPDDLRALRFATFLDGLERGVAAHHAGMLPAFKETVEELFKLGLVRAVFATETLALGINMPARSVVIERLSKFTGERHELLTPTDYTQLTGRAGRRGIDELGYGVTLFNPWVNVDKVASLATTRAYRLRSSFRLSYNMAVNLVRNHDPETATHVLNSSFAQFESNRAVVRWERELKTKQREADERREEAVCDLGDIFEYRRIRERATEAMASERGSKEVQATFARLVPGDVISARGLGKALVLEQPRTGKGGAPRITVMTTDRKLRRVTPRDFRAPPEPAGKVTVRGQSWRSPKVRKGLAKELVAVDLQKRAAPPSKREVQAMIHAYQEHPCHGCPDLDAHLRAAERSERAAADARRLRRQVRRNSDTVARGFELLLRMLRAQGYVEDWGLTGKGEVLARIYSEADLLIVECLTRGWLASLEPADLAAVMSLFTYESRGRDEPEGPPTTQLARYRKRVADLYDRLAAEESAEGVELLKEPDDGFMAACHEWANGATLEQVLQERDTSPGDFVRATKQVIDLLQQVRQVVEEPELARALGRAVDAVQRGVVAHSAVI